MVAIVLRSPQFDAYFVASIDGVWGEDGLGYSTIIVSEGDKNGGEFDAALQV
jgi:hypothetical protein